MKLTFKPLLIVLLALLIPCGVWADVEIDGIYYNLIAKIKQAEVTNGGTTGRYSGNIVIPESVVYEGVTYSVTVIASNAFRSSSLTSISIPNSVVSIKENAFYSSSLRSVTIPNSVTNIGSYAFAYSGVTSVEFPNHDISIGEFAFACSNLQSVTIPDGFTLIRRNTFGGCSMLSTVFIPSSVTYIEREAFYNCPKLTSVNIDDLEAWCKIYFYDTYSNPLNFAQHLFLNGEEVKELVIPDGVTYISEYAFYNCIGLTSVNIPNSVTSIGNWAFDGCTSLSTVIIPNSVTQIGTFRNCKNLMEVKCFAKSVPWAPVGFQNSLIEYATLYVPTASIEEYRSTSPWSGFGTIKSLTDGILFKDEAVEALCLANWDTNEDGELGMDEAASVTDLGSVFANNTDITSFDELQYFTGLTSIGEQAFYYCSNLTSVIIPENVTTIGNRAFYVCSGLKSLHIPASVTSIEDRAFAYCSGLETIEVDENNPYYDSRNNCNALIQTNTNTLLVGCKNSVIPDGVTIIAEGAFRGCTELTSMEIPEGVTTIGASAFRGCTGLTSVTLPSTITSIGNYAFSAFDEVYNLTSVKVGMTNPVAITSEVFPNRANSILYVPKGSRSAYKAANYWKEFKNIMELEDGELVKCEPPTITRLANGKIKVECVTEGATCFTNITASNAEPLTDSEINLNTPLIVYTVTAYATADGYANSDVATATFRWEKTEGDMNGDGQVNISDVIQLVNIILQQ